MCENDGQFGIFHITEHKQRDEDQVRQHGHREQSTVSGRLFKTSLR